MLKSEAKVYLKVLSKRKRTNSRNKYLKKNSKNKGDGQSIKYSN